MVFTLKISGLAKLTLLDFPGYTACTVFLGGCNFRCPFCHNAPLVSSDDGDEISEDEFFSFLLSRKGRLDGVCISGGEPTLREGLSEFAGKIKANGFLVKLDTNGSRPEVISEMIDNKLCDYIAMDIKNSPDKYAVTCGKESLDISPVMRSVAVLKENAVPYEFRTTLVRGLHDEGSVTKAGEWLRGADKWFLQAFRDSGSLVGKVEGGFDYSEYSRFLDIARRFVPNAQLRGI